MKNVILSDNDTITVLAKVYADKSLKIIYKWKSGNLKPEPKVYLNNYEVEILKKHI